MSRARPPLSIEPQTTPVVGLAHRAEQSVKEMPSSPQIIFVFILLLRRQVVSRRPVQLRQDAPRRVKPPESRAPNGFHCTKCPPDRYVRGLSAKRRHITAHFTLQTLAAEKVGQNNGLCLTVAICSRPVKSGILKVFAENCRRCRILVNILFQHGFKVT